MTDGDAHPRIITERKVKIDGTVREYRCELVHRAPGLTVVAFRMRGGGQLFGTPIVIPPQSISYGYFWRAQPYSIYRMKDASGAILAHRFDAVTDVRFDEDAVTYRDLVLDWWVAPDDTLIEEDRDEFDEAVASGALRGPDVLKAKQAARMVTSRYRHIIDGLADLERRILRDIPSR